MAKNRNTEDITRFYMSNAYVTQDVYENGQFAGKAPVEYASKDFDKQVAEVLRALQSATNGLARVTKKVDEFGNAMATFDVPDSTFASAQPAFSKTLQDIETKYGYSSGSLRLDPYDNGLPFSDDFQRITFHKNLKGTLAKRRAKDIMKSVGGFAEEDPSKTQPDRMRMSFDVSHNDWEAEVARSKGDVAKARKNLVSRFTRANLAEPERYSNDIAEREKEKEEEKRQREKEKEEKASKREEKAQANAKKATTRKMFRKIGAIISAVIAVADITRRILTAVLAQASQVRQQSMDAKKLGISYTSMREYNAQEKAMGLRKGIFTSAIGSLQSAFGDITNLDEGALGELAKVLHGNVIEAINQGLGRSNPEKLLGLILDSYYKRGEQGVNSIGQNVGKYQAERELSTALEKAGLADVADILRNMYYSNDTGIYKDRIDMDNAFQSYMNLITSYTNGLTGADYRYVSDVGQVWGNLQKSIDDLKDSIEQKLLLKLGGLITAINNWTIGQSASEKLDTNESKIALNNKAREAMKKKSQLATTNAENLANSLNIGFKDFGLQGVTDLGTFIDYLIENPNWKLNANNPAQAYFAQQMKTARGDELLRQIDYVYTTKALEEKARNAINLGQSTGTTNYDDLAYTDEGLDLALRANLSTNTKSPAFIIGKQTRATAMPSINGAQTALTNADAYAVYKTKYLSGRDFGLSNIREMDYDDIAMITKHLANKAKERLNARINSSPNAQDRRAWEARLSRLETAQTSNPDMPMGDFRAVVMQAVSEGVLSEADIKKAFVANILNQREQGWGISSRAQRLLIESASDEKLSRTTDTGVLNNAMTALVEGDAFKSWFNSIKNNIHGSVGATAKGYAYDERTKTFKIDLTLKAGGRTFQKTFEATSDFVGTGDMNVDVSGLFDSMLYSNNGAGN
jgi:hypothetical protein